MFALLWEPVVADYMMAVIASKYTFYFLWAVIAVGLGVFLLDLAGLVPASLPKRRSAPSAVASAVSAHAQAAKEMVQPTIEEDAAGTRRDRLGRVHSLKCSSCGGVMKRKRKARHHPLAALFMLCLGVAFGLVGTMFNITLVGVVLGFPVLIVGIIFFVIGVVWSFGIRRLWACLDCGLALERA